ncbi:HD domain-containing phosphohydrolase [Pyxidicoccus caerfyrddinensis]|uniref:HD domain-containing phosphohydrolase n=1 Tax=Pyxidicoccus caerfyrddinensis TaxID=2709663 RepID=UPI0013D9EDAB|nr:HD domain-containing phosphohydrolase [Pyxidicoccus caerfyrddinensis]
MAKKLGERLIEAGLVNAGAVEQALEHQKITGHKLGDCLVELGLLQEAGLLRFLAAEFQTRFVTADKLAKARIATEVLDRLPVRLAEAQNVLPLAVDPERKLLSVVAAEPQNKALMDEIALVTGMSEVYAYVGLRGAIAAAIRKHYYGDPTAFTALLESPGAQVSPPVPSRTGAAEHSRTTTSGRSTMTGLSSLNYRMETDPRLRVHRPSGATPAARPSTQRREPGGPRGIVSDADYVETLGILVGLLEQDRQRHRGHSAQLARQAGIVGQRMGMPHKELAALSIAAYLHDLGKPSERHFSLASNAVNADWKAQAKQACRAPTKLFETVHLPTQTNTILAQLYEAWDGSGTPQGAKGEDITLGARILAAVDSFLELTKNPGNAHGKAFTKEQALEHLRTNKGVLYDPVVADIVIQLQSGELLRHRLESEGRQVLVVEPDEAARGELLEAVLKHGLVAHALSTMEGAQDGLARQDCDVLVVSLRLGQQEVMDILQQARSTPETAGLPIAVVGEPDAATRERLVMAGASAVLAPGEKGVIAKAVGNLLEDRVLHNGPGRVVRGSFDELPPKELLRTLAGGFKNGRLHLRQHTLEGYLHLERGRVVFASFGGHSGEPALQALLKLKQADFQYDPDALLLDVPQMDQDLQDLLALAGAVSPG